MKKKIAITGGIGSGKSVAARYLADLGYPVFSCDEIYKEIIESPAYIEKIEHRFPKAVKNKRIDRKALAQAVFNSKENLQFLNSVSHPLIMECLLKKMEKVNSDLVFAEVPLLFEGHFENLFDKVLVLLRDEEKRKKDLVLRDNLSEKEIDSRMQSQFCYTSNEGRLRLKNCNACVIENNGNLHDLKNKIDQFLTVT